MVNDGWISRRYWCSSSSPSAGTISMHFLSSLESSIAGLTFSLTFCFLEMSDLRCSAVLLVLLSCSSFTLLFCASESIATKSITFLISLLNSSLISSKLLPFSTTIPAAATIVKIVVLTPRAKGIVFHKQEQLQIPTVSSSKDKGKANIIEPEVLIKRKNHMRIDEEYARKLQAEEQEVARLSRAQQDEKTNNSWGYIQATMDADRLLAERFQAREREEFSEV
nr:hypothetical protein [Tanacetum cinerariifolium]